MIKSMIAGGLALCLSSALAGTHRQQADPKVTLTIPAMRASKALKLLGSYVHATYETSPQTANEIIVMRLTDVPLSEVLRRIALAVDGTWKQEQDVVRLIRTSDQAKSDGDALEYAQDVEAIRKSIDKRAEALKKMPPWSSSEADSLALQVKSLVKAFNPHNNRDGRWYQQASSLSEAGPLGRTVTQIASLLDPKELADLPPYLTTVWSSKSNRNAKSRYPVKCGPSSKSTHRDQGDWLKPPSKDTN